MATNARQYLTIDSYQPGIPPTDLRSFHQWFLLEYPRMANAISQLQMAAMQATSQPPKNPEEGMIRLAVLPWDPLSVGHNAVVTYSGAAWVAL